MGAFFVPQNPPYCDFPSTCYIRKQFTNPPSAASEIRPFSPSSLLSRSFVQESIFSVGGPWCRTNLCAQLFEDLRAEVTIARNFFDNLMAKGPRFDNLPDNLGAEPPTSAPRLLSTPQPLRERQSAFLPGLNPYQNNAIIRKVAKLKVLH